MKTSHAAFTPLGSYIIPSPVHRYDLRSCTRAAAHSRRSPGNPSRIPSPHTQVHHRFFYFKGIFSFFFGLKVVVNAFAKKKGKHTKSDKKRASARRSGVMLSVAMTTTPPHNLHLNGQGTVQPPPPPNAPKKKNPVISRAHPAECEPARRKLDFGGGVSTRGSGGGEEGGGGGGSLSGGGEGGTPLTSPISKMKSFDR